MAFVEKRCLSSQNTWIDLWLVQSCNNLIDEHYTKYHCKSLLKQFEIFGSRERSKQTIVLRIIRFEKEENLINENIRLCHQTFVTLWTRLIFWNVWRMFEDHFAAIQKDWYCSRAPSRAMIPAVGFIGMTYWPRWLGEYGICLGSVGWKFNPRPSNC